jgi:hypothetical protein
MVSEMLLEELIVLFFGIFSTALIHSVLRCCSVSKKKPSPGRESIHSEGFPFPLCHTCMRVFECNFLKCAKEESSAGNHMVEKEGDRHRFFSLQRYEMIF